MMNLIRAAVYKFGLRPKAGIYAAVHEAFVRQDKEN